MFRLHYYSTKAFALFTTFPTVKPYSLITSSPGVDPPNLLILMILPSSVTYLSQPTGDPVSTANLFCRDRGNIFSL